MEVDFPEIKNFKISYQITIYKDDIFGAETEDEARDLWHKEHCLEDAEILDLWET